MDNEIGKWYKAPRGMIYRINFGSIHPITGLFFLEVEMFNSIFDYSKRSAATRYEVLEWFYQFYIDKQEKDEQDILNEAYITCKLLNDTYEQAQRDNNIDDMEILHKRFKFIRDSKTIRVAEISDLKQILDIQDGLTIEIVNAYQAIKDEY